MENFRVNSNEILIYTRKINRKERDIEPDRAQKIKLKNRTDTKNRGKILLAIK